MGWVLVFAVGVAVGVLINKFRARSESAGKLLSASQDERAEVESNDAEEAFAEIFRDAVNSLSVGVVVAGADGTVIFRNTLALGLTGAVHSDVLVDEAVEVHLSGALARRTGRQVIDLFGPPRKVVAVFSSPLEGGGAVAMIEDITERHLVDTVRTDFVANISHELKTPVGALAVLAEALADEDDLDIVHRLSEKMVDEAIRVGRTIDDLLELSRIEFGGEAVKDPVSVESILQESIERVRSLATSHSIRVVMNTPDADMQAIGDRRQLVSAVSNLVENAVKYSEPDSSVEVSALVDSDWVEMCVQDFGVGIPLRDLDRIFERFYRVDRARSRDTGGTGLGLAIVRHVANNHGGEVSVTSIEGEGSTFVLKIPRFTMKKENP
ncbi:two-component sensor histidine kinase [Actinomycetes bacterium]|nr:two-component sensor histidine kinase [Actinomycetes bacterium]